MPSRKLSEKWLKNITKLVKRLRKKCSRCKKWKSFKNFHFNKSQKHGLAAYCKPCANQHRKECDWKASPLQRMLQRSRERAKYLKLPHNIDESDIIIPEYCPVLGLRLKVGIDGRLEAHNPSVDRMINELGYIKGNVRIISQRANMLKNNGTVEEFERVIGYLKEIENLKEYNDACDNLRRKGGTPDVPGGETLNKKT